MLYRTLCAVCGLLLLLSAKPCRSDLISPQMRAEDTRLEIPVTFQSARIRIGELLERLTKETGVNLRIREETEGSGVIVFASLSKVPLASALNALASLVGTRSASWQWERDKEEDKFVYRLRLADLNGMGQGWYNKIQTAFE